MTFVIKTRGAPRVIASEYLCPEHGRFDLDVTSPAPDFQPCPKCGAASEWVISAPAKVKAKSAEVTRGKYEKPERKTWLDTRELGEGMPLWEWREKRQAIRDEERRKTLKELMT